MACDDLSLIPTPDIDSIEIEGQSNAIGNAAIAGLQAELVGVNANARTFVRVSDADLTSSWVTLESGVNNTGNLAAATTFGIEMRLMQLMVSEFGGTQKLFHYAVGGTSLSVNWRAGLGGLYYNSLNQFRQGRALYQATFGKAYEGLRCSIFIQGEQDTASAGDYNTYQARQTDWIHRKRQDYLQLEMPIILVSLSSAQTAFNATGRAAVNAAKEACARNKYSGGVVTVNPSGIEGVWYLEQNEPCSDSAHYTPTGYDNIAYDVMDIITQL